jgi:hypothetical protein
MSYIKTDARPIMPPVGEPQYWRVESVACAPWRATPNEPIWKVTRMKLLAAVFAAILVFAMLPGFVLDVMPLLAMLGKMSAAVALAGLTVCLIADAGEIASGHAEFNTDAAVEMTT